MVFGFFALYLLLLLAIGYFAYRRTHTFSDYLIGGGRVSALPGALSATASDMNGWLLLVLPGLAMTTGFTVFWLAGALLIGSWLNWLVVAQRLRAFSHRAGDVLTLPGYFEYRFGDHSRVLRTVSSLFILLFFLCYSCAGMIAAGQLLSQAFAMNYSVAVLICASTALAYTQLGGFLAVAWSDVAQGLLILLVLILVPWLVIDSQGGLDLTLAQVSSKNPDLLNMLTDAQGQPLTAMSLLATLGLTLGYFGQPHILARFMGIRSRECISIARRIAVIWTGFALTGACMIGIAAIGVLPQAATDDKQVFLLLAQLLFDPVIAAALAIAILAAIMSTLDSQLLVAASALSEDLYRGLFNRPASQTLMLKAGRRSVLLLGLIAMLMAMDSESAMLQWLSVGWAGLGAAFGPVLIASLYWQRMNGFGALAGMLAGGSTVLIWQSLQGGIFELYAIYPGFAAASLALVVGSLITPAPDNRLRMVFATVRRALRH